MEKIRLGTRKSALAMRQTELVAEAIRRAYPEVKIEIVQLTTRGDRDLDAPLRAFGGKGAFAAEFEEALQSGVIDAAVHSAKDLPTELCEGLGIAMTLPREDARDVLVTQKNGKKDVCWKAETKRQKYRMAAASSADASLSDFCIGTGSLRREAQITALANVSCASVRGNVPTRIEKLRDGQFDGLLLAAAGLKRLGLDHEPDLLYRYLSVEEMTPAGGQGIIAVEAKADTTAFRMLAAIGDRETYAALETERYVLQRLDAGCHAPVGVYAKLRGEQIEITLMQYENGRISRRHLCGSCTDRLALAGQLVGK